MRLSLLTMVLIFGTGLLMAQPQRSSVVDSLKRQLAKAPHDSTRLRLYTSIAQHYYARTQYDSLYPFVQRGIQLLTKSPSHILASELYFLLAWYHRHNGEYRRGIAPLKQAISHARQNHNPKRTAELQYYLAVIYSDADDLSNAVDQIAANLRFLREYEDGPTLAANYLLMVALFQELKNTDMEKLYMQKYLALDKCTWPAEDRLLANLVAGDNFARNGQFNEAEYQYRKGLQYARLTPTPDYRITEVLEVLGINARNQKQYQTAIKFLNSSFAKAQSIKNLSYMGSAKRELATTYMACQRPQEALKEARYALLLARQHKEPTGIIASMGSLVAVLEATGQDREALQLYREQHQLKEQKFTEDNVQKIVLMQAQFDAETKEKTIKILQKNAQISQLNALRQQEQLTLAQRTQLAGALVISLMALVIGLIIHGLRKSRRNYATLTRQQELLQQTASQLAETNSVKDKLFSLIGHDLRSPVASMKNNLRQLRAIDGQTDQLPPLMDRLDKQVDNILTLLTNLLDWSMIQLKGFQSILQPVRLADVTEEVISQASELIRHKELGIINQVETTHIALADRHQIRAVVRNLVSNAIKFTPTGGFIRLVSRVEDNHVELHIRDSGLGMSNEQVATLFTAPEVRTGTLGEIGTGLGLQICREMLERQGGQLQIDSRVGKGTFIRIRLAVPQEAVLPHQPLSDIFQVV